MTGPEGLFAASRDHVIAFDAGGVITYRNPVATARALDVDTAERLAAVARRVAATGQAEALEWGDEGSSGVVRAWFQTEVSAIEGGALAISRDITASRRRDKLMVDTQGVAHLGTWEWDVTKPHATWSGELYRIYGLTPETYTPSYEAYLKMVHDDDRQRVSDATNRVFHEHVPYSHDERIYRPDGSMRYLHTWAHPVLDENGKLTHLIGVCQDITDVQRTRELEIAMRELEAFNSMVSHDLRAPLAVVQMSADLLQSVVEGSPNGRKYVERIKRAVTNMSQLMDDLLAFARVGQDTLQVERVDVSALAADVVGELRAAQPQRDVAIKIAPALELTADPRLARVMLTNVLGNAWKYTGHQSSARIEVGRVVRNGVSSVFVRDNGIGFDPKDAARVFAPFERLRNAGEFSGSGIGLAIVHKIVERHGGRVEAESRPGEGATFYVTLPVT